MHHIQFEPPVPLEIAEAAAYYEAERAGWGFEFLTELESLLERIATNPRLYPRFRQDARKTTMARFPYTVAYWFDDANVHVVAVLDARRDPRILERRIPK